jgi:hypothetical protein
VKVLSWIIALFGLWEFGDIAALFVPGFGRIQPLVWNHIIVGLILMIVGAWAARTSHAGTARTTNWIAIVAGTWLIMASFVLGNPFIAVGRWNDIIVGVIVLILGVRIALTSPRIRD